MNAEPTTTEPASAGPVRSWGWHLLQVTTWLLAPMLLIELLGTWVFHDPGHFSVAFYIDRWSSNAWRIFDAVFIALALLHGGLGLVRMLRARVRPEWLELALVIVLAVVITVVGLLAMSTALTFDVTP